MKLDVAKMLHLLVLCSALVGCDVTPPAGSSAAPPAPPGAAPPPPAASPVAAPASEPNTERVAAQAGVGAQGRSLDPHEGVIVTPVKAFFAAKERIAFEAQFKHQYDLYKAMDGAVPKDFADLEAKVLKPYQIKLPPLPQGHRYVWDADGEELQVERPRPQ